MPIRVPPTIQAAQAPAQTILSYKDLLDATSPDRDPTDLKQVQLWLTTESRISQEVENLEATQISTISDLKSHRERMNKDLQVPQVAALRSLIEDASFSDAMKSFDSAIAVFVSKESESLGDERTWMVNMGIFFRTSAQNTLNETGKPGERTTVTIPGTSISAASRKRIQEDYLPIWKAFRLAVLEYGSKADQATQAAREACPGSTTEAAANIIRIKILRRLYLSVEFQRRLLFQL